MTKQAEFVAASFKGLVAKFNNIICRYEYQSLSDAHYIEINPSIAFNSIELKQVMAEILFSFYDQFPDESLVFLTKDDGIDLEWPEIVVIGDKFMPTWQHALQQNSVEGEYLVPITEDDTYFIAA